MELIHLPIVASVSSGGEVGQSVRHFTAGHFSVRYLTSAGIHKCYLVCDWQAPTESPVVLEENLQDLLQCFVLFFFSFCSLCYKQYPSSMTVVGPVQPPQVQINHIFDTSAICFCFLKVDFTSELSHSKVWRWTGSIRSSWSGFQMECCRKQRWRIEIVLFTTHYKPKKQLLLTQQKLSPWTEPLNCLDSTLVSTSVYQITASESFTIELKGSSQQNQ